MWVSMNLVARATKSDPIIFMCVCAHHWTLTTPKPPLNPENTRKTSTKKEKPNTTEQAGTTPKTAEQAEQNRTEPNGTIPPIVLLSGRGQCSVSPLISKTALMIGYPSSNRFWHHLKHNSLRGHVHSRRG